MPASAISSISASGTDPLPFHIAGCASTQTPPASRISASASIGASACFGTYAMPPSEMNRSNASFSVATMPASTIACAMCGRAIRSSPAIARTCSKEMSYPSSCSFSTISSPRRKRVSMSRRSSATKRGFAGSTQ